MELDEEELIEQEFDNICNKIFSINSLIDIMEIFWMKKVKNMRLSKKK